VLCWAMPTCGPDRPRRSNLRRRRSVIAAPVIGSNCDAAFLRRIRGWSGLPSQKFGERCRPITATSRSPGVICGTKCRRPAHVGSADAMTHSGPNPWSCSPIGVSGTHWVPLTLWTDRDIAHHFASFAQNCTDLPDFARRPGLRSAQRRKDMLLRAASSGPIPPAAPASGSGQPTACSR